MGRRGTKPKSKIKVQWSPHFAYAIGLIASDGSLSKDGRHISFVSKDIEQINNYLRALRIKNKIGLNKSSLGQLSYRVQFGDVSFYRFLNSVGLTSAKSLTIEKLDIPDKLFFDFLRGYFDGDGYSYSYYDPRWKKSFLFYIAFCSGSQKFITWLRETISIKLNIKGHVGLANKSNSCLQLKYAKKEACVLIRHLYKNGNRMCLSRKYLKISQVLDIVNDVKKES